MPRAQVGYFHDMLRSRGSSSLVSFLLLVFGCEDTGFADLPERAETVVGSGPQPKADASQIGDVDGASACVVVRAFRLSQAAQCIYENAVVDCIDVRIQCEDAHTLARDQRGQVWVLPHSCMPQGWLTVDAPVHPAFAIWPSCM